MKFDFRNKLMKLLVIVLLIFGLTSCKPEEQPKLPNDKPTLDTRYTDGLKIDFEFDGKDFLNDGVGEVTLTRVVDGDTIHVRTKDSSTVLKIRLLGIDTPESTGKIEPWGGAASAFAKGLLDNAVSIVLEAEGERLDSTGRYLAYVWYKANDDSEYRLYNLEAIENAYTYSKLSSGKYFDVFKSAEIKSKETGKRVFGERDPQFNYSKDVVPITIAYLLANPDEFTVGTKFLFQVQVVRRVGHNFYLTDLETTEIGGEDIKGSIYAFSGYGVSYSSIKIGDVITFQAQFQLGGDYGTQLTGVRSLRVIDNLPVEITEIDSSTLTEGGMSLQQYEGQVLRVKNLKLTEVYQSATDIEKNLYTLRFITTTGKEISVRLASELSQYSREELQAGVGKLYDVIGGVSYYEHAPGKYQIVVGDKYLAIDLIKQ